jgi:hypothetical protein
MSKTIIPKAQTTITAPTVKTVKHPIKKYGNTGMTCALVDGVYVLYNNQGVAIAQKATLQEIDDEHMLY